MSEDFPNERDCQHGQLRRSCNICEYEARITTLEGDLEKERYFRGKAEDRTWAIQQERARMELQAESSRTNEARANKAEAQLRSVKAVWREQFPATDAECRAGPCTPCEPLERGCKEPCVCVCHIIGRPPQPAIARDKGATA